LGITSKPRRSIKKVQTDHVHPLPLGSGDTRCVLCATVLLFHWQLKHLENKNKDKVFLGVTMMFHRAYSLLPFKKNFLPDLSIFMSLLIPKTQPTTVGLIIL
jgi:hypothetical protein